MGPINDIQSSVQIMVWRLPGDKTFSEAMMVGLLTHAYAIPTHIVKIPSATIFCSRSSVIFNVVTWPNDVLQNNLWQVKL